MPPEPRVQQSPLTHGTENGHGRSRLFILNFHGIGQPSNTIPSSERRYWIQPEIFERFLERAAQWPDVQITFDDGNYSDFSTALPALVDRHIRASFFILAGRIGVPGYLGITELRQLLAAGMDIGSHGMNHQSWRHVHGDELRREIVDAKNKLEDSLGVPVTQAACPFGEYDRNAIHLLSSAGFERVYTSDRGWTKPTAWMQSRNTVTAETKLAEVERVRSWSQPRQWAHRLKLALKRCR